VELQSAIAAVLAPTLEETADDSLAWLARPAVAPVALQSGRDGLTRRERDVVGLLARGLTNRESASTLVLTEGTAENYVQRVLGKLGFNNRTQVATWALSQAS
jgi:non-specific serine/threonine protein kinase